MTGGDGSSSRRTREMSAPKPASWDSMPSPAASLPTSANRLTSCPARQSATPVLAPPPPKPSRLEPAFQLGAAADGTIEPDDDVEVDAGDDLNFGHDEELKKTVHEGAWLG